MIDALSDEDLRALLAVDSPNCISLYLPTHASGPGVAEDPIRLKNLMATAKHELEAGGMRTSDAAELLGPAEAMVDDPQFWAHSAEGLAIFVTSDGAQRFRLAGPVEEAVVVADRYWIAPLIPFVATGGTFYVLALSDNQVRLLQGQRYEVTELDLGVIPASRDDALRFDDRESQLHSHGANRVGSGAVSATFHGHGVANDFDDVDRTRFLQAVDRGLAGIVGDTTSPLVVAGVEELVARFREISSHANIVEPLIGNPEHLSSAELHERTLPLVAPHLDADRLRALESYGSPSTPTADSLSDALVAATSGRVGRLIILAGRRVWGSYDADTRTIREHADRQPGDRDLVDLAARETIAHGGVVFAADEAEMPGDAPVAAMLRY